MPEINLTVGGDQTASDEEVRKLLEPPPEAAGGGEKPLAREERPAEGEERPAADFELDEADEPTGRVDEELAAAATDADREQIRARRRLERKERKERGREKVQTLERMVQGLLQQNQEMSQQLATLTNSSLTNQLTQVDQAIGQANQAADHFKAIIADATTKGDGRTVAEATEHMIAARTRAQQLTQVREAQLRQTKQPRPLDPVMANHAVHFMEEHRWFNSRSNDPDSKVMSAIDNSLAAEGWDPTQPSYWEELRARGARYLPHRFTARGGKPGYNGPTAAGGGSPVAGSSDGGSTSRAGSTGYGLSAERVKAMKDAGIWDDPKRRDAMIKRYREADKSAN